MTTSTPTPSQHPTKVFKILTAEQWSAWASAGSFTGASIDLTDGYIHLSTLDQAVETHDKFFAGQKGLVLVLVDLEKVSAAWCGLPCFPFYPTSLYSDTCVEEVETEVRRHWRRLRLDERICLCEPSRGTMRGEGGEGA